jgi:hypothetical protein
LLFDRTIPTAVEIDYNDDHVPGKMGYNKQNLKKQSYNRKKPLTFYLILITKCYLN